MIVERIDAPSLADADAAADRHRIRRLPPANDAELPPSSPLSWRMGCQPEVGAS